MNAVNAVKSSTPGEPEAETRMPRNENSSNTVPTENLDEQQSRLLELERTLGVFDNDAVLVVDAEGITIEMDNNFGNGGIGLPENGNRVVL